MTIQECRILRMMLPNKWYRHLINGNDPDYKRVMGGMKKKGYLRSRLHTICVDGMTFSKTEYMKEVREKALEVKQHLDDFIETELNRPPTPNEFQGIT